MCRYVKPIALFTDLVTYIFEVKPMYKRHILTTCQSIIMTHEIKTPLYYLIVMNINNYYYKIHIRAHIESSLVV